MKHVKHMSIAKAESKGDGEVEIELFSVLVALFTSFLIKNPPQT